MDTKTAARISKASRALKHCEKLLDTVDKKGEVRVVLNCTGVTFIVKKDDAMYLRISTTRAQLLEEIASIRITEEPVVPAMTAEEKAEIKKQKQREYMRNYYARKRAEKVPAAT